MRLLIILSLFIGSSVLAVDIPEGYEEATLNSCHQAADVQFPKATTPEKKSYCQCAVGHFISVIRKAEQVTHEMLDKAVYDAQYLCNIDKLIK